MAKCKVDVETKSACKDLFELLLYLKNESIYTDHMANDLLSTVNSFHFYTLRVN